MYFYTAVLVMLGLVALASTSIGDPAISKTFLVDTQNPKYHCEGKDIIRCETTTGGSCLAAYVCKKHCFKYDEGAACVDMGEAFKESPSDIEKSTAQVPACASDVHFVAGDASPQEHKHFACSKDRSSVLICRYGFCSTYHYCKSNEECNDSAVLCKSKLPSTQGSKSEVRAVANRIEDAPLKLDTRNRSPKEKSSYVCSKDRTSILKCSYGFCATNSHCAKGHPCVDKPARCRKALTSQI